MALCHEVTERVVAALEREPVDLLVAYHPLLFRPVQSLIAGPTPAGRALRLNRRGVALAIAHRAGMIEDEVLHDLERDLDLEETGALYQRGD